MHRMKKLMALLLAASILCLSFSEEVLATDHIHIDGDLEDHAAQEETEIDEEMKDEEEPGAGDTSENQEDEQIENEEEKSEASGNEQTEESEEISGSLKDEEAIPVLPGNERPDTSEVMPEVPENVQTDVTGEVSENPEDEEKIEGPKDETPDVSAETPEDIGEQERKDLEDAEYTESVSLQMDTLQAAPWMDGMLYNEHFANWCFYKDNQILWDYTGLASNENGWWYVKNGVLDWNYTGVVSYGDGWWYVKNGQLDWSYTGVAPNENGWWYIKNGALDWSYTGLASNENGWWYIANGALDWNYTGVVSYGDGWWYVKNGQLDWSYTGVAPNENGWWYIKNGQLDWSYTGVAPNENGWWYIRNGALDWSYTGLASNENGWWYIRNGQLDWGYTGEVYHNGEKYRVVNGAVVFGDAAFRLNSCAASKNSNGHMTITLGIERNGTLESLYNEYYIVMLNGTGDSVINGVKGNILPGGAFRISADFYSNDEFRTTVMCKYALAAWNGQQYTIISNARYIDNPEVTATMTKSYMGYYTSDKITSKKGLQGVSEGYTEDLGVQHTLLNVNLADMVSMNARTGYVPYSYKGKTYYFQDMIALSRTVRYLNGWDLDNPYGSHKRSVTLVLLMGWNDELSYLIHPSARNRGAASYYALNMQDQNARDTFEALFCYMGEKLGDNKTLVSNWTLGNEVNSCRVWNYSGNMSLHECVANYAEAFQLLYQGVRRTASESKVFISLDHCWTASDAGHSGMEYLNEFAAYMSQTAPSVQWNVNYHPYSHPLNRNDFWSDNGNTTASWNTPYISMKNINVLTDYLGNIESSYGKPGGSIRVILGEIGFSAVKGNSGQENGQAAALGYGYYIALFNSRIDAYIARAYQDDPAEEQMGLYFGLRNRGDEKKVSYDVYKRLDTTESLAYMNPYLPYIQLSSWESAIPGFNAGALPAVDF